MQSDLNFSAVEAVKAATGAKKVRYDGIDYVPKRDDVRLSGQLLRVFTLMRDGRWRTLDDIASATNDPAASVSAQIRHLRKAKFGKHTVNRRYLGEGLYEYQLIEARHCQMCGAVTDEFFSASDGTNPALRVCGNCVAER